MMPWHACDSISSTSDCHLRCLKRGVIGSSKAAILGKRRDRSVCQIAGYKPADVTQFLTTRRVSMDAIALKMTREISFRMALVMTLTPPFRLNPSEGNRNPTESAFKMPAFRRE